MMGNLLTDGYGLGGWDSNYVGTPMDDGDGILLQRIEIKDAQ